MWTVIDSGKKQAHENMNYDQNLLDGLDHSSQPILHLYDWEGDSATYGYFIQPDDFLVPSSVKRLNLNLARRPTGGGIVFHITDLAFSVLIPSSHPSFSSNTLENYRYVNEIVVRALRHFQNKITKPLLLGQEPSPLDTHCTSFCMAKPTRYDVMIDGKKIGGAAQRRMKQGLLHQGTINLGHLSQDYLEELLIPGTQVLRAMGQNTASLLGESWTLEELNEVKKEMKQVLVEIFKQES